MLDSPPLTANITYKTIKHLQQILLTKQLPKNSLAVVENAVLDLDGEAGGAVEAIPGGVGRGAGVGLEGYVGAQGGGVVAGARRGPRGTPVCNK